MKPAARPLLPPLARRFSENTQCSPTFPRCCTRLLREAAAGLSRGRSQTRSTQRRLFPSPRNILPRCDARRSCTRSPEGPPARPRGSTAGLCRSPRRVRPAIDRVRKAADHHIAQLRAARLASGEPARAHLEADLGRAWPFRRRRRRDRRALSRRCERPRPQWPA